MASHRIRLAARGSYNREGGDRRDRLALARQRRGRRYRDGKRVLSDCEFLTRTWFDWFRPCRSAGWWLSARAQPRDFPKSLPPQKTHRSLDRSRDGGSDDPARCRTRPSWQSARRRTRRVQACVLLAALRL